MGGSGDMKDLKVESQGSFSALIPILLGGMGGAGIAAVVLSSAMPNLLASLFGPQPTVYWYLARSSAWAAYLLLWASMMLGLMMTSKTARAWPGVAETLDLHQFTSLLGLGLAMFHGLILGGDPYLSPTLGQILIPFFFGTYRPVWIGFGQVSIYLFVLLYASFYVRRWIKPRGWRLIHFLSFLTFAGVFVHGIMSGTDSSGPVAFLVYAATGGFVFFGIIFRILVSANAPARTATRPATNIRLPSRPATGRVQSDLS
jgi:predicted ferric reductase